MLCFFSLAPRSLRFTRSNPAWATYLVKPIQSSHTSHIDNRSRFMSTQTPSHANEISMPAIQITGQDGQKITRKIVPSYPDKPKAIANLLKLMSDIHLVEGPSRNWELHTTGNIISRLAFFNSQQAIDQARRDIAAAADEMHHHPTIFSDSKTTSRPYMLIACTTHSPPGLSVKDAKLARKVDEILAEMARQDGSKDEALTTEELSTIRQDAWTHIEAEISESCGCASRHG